jgi:uncharacterized protein YneR|tara:strand:+ start:159 stop:734 length:576 start_codon:yes stop_codon:yes gene_type:complete
MRQVLLILSVHLFLFLVLFAYHVQADEDQWYVEEFDTFVVTAKNGEVTHGDKLRFFMNKGDCSRMGILFSFTTMKNHKNIQSLQDKTLPIKINGHQVDDAAKVILVQNLFRDMNIVMMQAPGLKSVKDMINAMMAWYEDKNFFGIELVSEPGFDPQDYFDITDNNWKLDHLPEKIIQAQRLCFGPDELKTS